MHIDNLYDIFPRANRHVIKVNDTCKELVLYSNYNMESSINKPDLTDILRYMYNIPNDLYYILVGILLSDGTLAYASNKNMNATNISTRKDRNGLKAKNNILQNNCRFRLKQSIDHAEYLLFVGNLLAPYSPSYPKNITSTFKGKKFYGLNIYTRALPCFSIIRQKFYVGRVKTIPNDIYDHINYASIAHIIIGDGAYTNKGITLNLQCFTVPELILLMNVFYIKFDIKCSLHKSRDAHVIYIKVDSVRKLYPHIKKYILPNMRYKFDLNFN
ncbi:hypothetical protein BABINDRAFT_42624 [Babjeviella inositovora NRRL Y-12698]|uniref:Homing endonuclease LAGLIDADG domain-containing protein n=1 Tax=Babjeviella inositovora NRRL Y-12698 TaxID=984486 RepID=A0A1E3QGU6_9ASCO|nr:uncharacterized protein BABINDRAFT_42624 [Babjeviella inositovora NRRL Y-12698]ODQ76911.1 hypothetical protein BABINDRAFT_42624 [Babjeviella inositovora NRRL Y-12698]